MIMKKTFITLFALIAMGGSAMAGDKPVISVTDVEALPGETVSFSVNLVDGKADTYTAMTLNVYFPTEGFTTTGDYTVASTWKGASCTVGDINPVTGLATMPFASSNTITGSAVDNLVTVEFAVANTVPVGEYEVTLQGTMFEYNADDKDYAEDVKFKVKVLDKATEYFTLDENSTTASVARTGVNVRVIRTIKANSWNTICLPFEMDEDQVKDVFGDDVILKTFKSYDIETSGNDVTKITINFEDADLSEDGFESNRPYLIKVSQQVNEFSLKGVDIEPDDVEETSQKGENTKKKDGSFIGTYCANTTIPENDLFISNNKFYYSKGLTKIRAFRAYFSLKHVLANLEDAGARINMVDDEATGIDTVHGANGNAEGTYDLQGRKIENPKKGLYINNGKKVVVK